MALRGRGQHEMFFEPAWSGLGWPGRKAVTTSEMSRVSKLELTGGAARTGGNRVPVLRDRVPGVRTSPASHGPHTEVIEPTMDGFFIAVRTEMTTMP
jgi:hypothetical protein